MSKCYSTNDEDFHDDFSIILDEFADNNEVGDEVEFWEGEQVKQVHNSTFSVDDIIDSMSERAYNIAPEHCDSYLDDLDDEKKAELEKLVLDWLNSNVKQPSFYLVEKVEMVKGVWDGECVSVIMNAK